MSVLTTQPSNVNFLSPLGFNFAIKKLPNVNYFVQSVNVPSISLGETDLPTPFIRMPMIGDHMTFNDLTLSFKIDEDMKNYVELFNWIVELGFPENYQQSKNIRQNVNSATVMDDKPFSDATLQILNSAMKANLEIEFNDLVPTTLGEIVMNTTASSVDYLQCECTFRYRQFKIFDIGNGSRTQLTS